MISKPNFCVKFYVKKFKIDCKIKAAFAAKYKEKGKRLGVIEVLTSKLILHLREQFKCPVDIVISNLLN